jgi:hypothetical protein
MKENLENITLERKNRVLISILRVVCGSFVYVEFHVSERKGEGERRVKTKIKKIRFSLGYENVFE